MNHAECDQPINRVLDDARVVARRNAGARLVIPKKCFRSRQRKHAIDARLHWQVRSYGPSGWFKKAEPSVPERIGLAARNFEPPDAATTRHLRSEQWFQTQYRSNLWPSSSKAAWKTAGVPCECSISVPRSLGGSLMIAQEAGKRSPVALKARIFESGT
jgi:hypothetical protein